MNCVEIRFWLNDISLNFFWKFSVWPPMKWLTFDEKIMFPLKHKKVQKNKIIWNNFTEFFLNLPYFTRYVKEKLLSLPYHSFSKVRKSQAYKNIDDVRIP